MKYVYNFCFHLRRQATGGKWWLQMGEYIQNDSKWNCVAECKFQIRNRHNNNVTWPRKKSTYFTLFPHNLAHYVRSALRVYCVRRNASKLLMKSNIVFLLYFGSFVFCRNFAFVLLHTDFAVRKILFWVHFYYLFSWTCFDLHTNDFESTRKRNNCAAELPCECVYAGAIFSLPKFVSFYRARMSLVAKAAAYTHSAPTAES